MTVDKILTEAAATFKQRNEQYGDNYKNFGNVMIGIFPRGLHIETPDEWNRLWLFVQIISKATRYAANMERGGHEDSAHDLSVYAAMLQEMTK